MKTIARYFFLVTVFLLGQSGAAFADEFHYNNMLIGERASGMGGAYTAISDDATGLYYNPAGTAYVGEKNFSASVNAFNSQTKKYENALAGQTFERTSTAFLANYFGIVKPFGDYRLGFSFAVPDSVSENQNQVFNNLGSSVSKFTINLSNRDTTFLFGPSISKEIKSDLSVGMTLYMHKRDAQLIVNQFIQYSDSSSHWDNKYFQLNEWGFRPILGIAWAPVEKLSLGLSLSKTFVLSSSATDQNTCLDTRFSSTIIYCPNSTSPAAPTLAVPATTATNQSRSYPLRTAIGAAYFVNSSLLVSADITHHTAVSDPIFGDKVATIDLALGTEYYLSKKWAVRAGVYTNSANSPTIQAGVTNIEEHINMYGVSMSLTNFTADSSVTIGGNFTYGKGQSQILGDTSAQNASAMGWLIFLSSSY
jgi:long-chain fatty acid transport protein